MTVPIHWHGYVNISVVGPGHFLSIFFAVFYKPEKAFRLAGRPGTSARNLLLCYGLPLIVAGSAARMFSYLGGGGNWPAGLTLFMINLCAFTLAVVLGANLVSRLALPFRSRADRPATLKLIILSFTPFLVSQLLTAISPALRIAGFLALAYALVLFATGARVMLQTPASKVSGYSLVAFFILLGIAWVVNQVLSGLLTFVF